MKIIIDTKTSNEASLSEEFYCRLITDKLNNSIKMNLFKIQEKYGCYSIKWICSGCSHFGKLTSAFSLICHDLIWWSINIDTSPTLEKANNSWKTVWDRIKDIDFDNIDSDNITITIN